MRRKYGGHGGDISVKKQGDISAKNWGHISAKNWGDIFAKNLGDISTKNWGDVCAKARLQEVSMNTASPANRVYTLHTGSWVRGLYTRKY